MRKNLIIILIVVAAALIYEYRYDLVFRFQYERLKGLACQREAEGFAGDSCLTKLWAHRVNTVERFRLLENRFAGYEADITWNRHSKQFQVYHPPAMDTAIGLDSFLSVVNTDIASLWLDMRGVVAADTSDVLAVLSDADKTGSLKLAILLEVYDVTMANFLAQHGYWVALNINTEWIQQYARASQWEQLRRSMSPRISFVSQEDKFVPLLKEHFPHMDIVTWSIAFNNYFNRKHLETLVNDDRVKIILVNAKSRYYK